MTTPTDSINGLKLVAMYNNDVPLRTPTAVESITESVAFGAVLVGGIKGVGYTWKGLKWMRHPIDNFAATKKTFQQNRAVRKSIVKNTSVGFNRHREYQAYKKLRQMDQVMPKNPSFAPGRTAKLVTNQVAKGNANCSYQAILRQVESMQAHEEFLSYSQKVKAQRANGSLMRAAKDKTGWTKLATKSKLFAAKNLKYAKLAKGIKGNIAAAVVFTLIGVVTEVIPAFKISAKSGVKQMGKTAIKAGVDIAAFAAGGFAGAKVGAGLGLVAGSFVPGVGNFVGAVAGGVLGFVGGFVASYYADEKMEKLLGKNEVEKAKDEKAEKEYQEALKNPEKLQQLVKKASKKMIENYYDGGLSDEDYIAAERLFGLDFNDDLTREYFVYLNDPQRYEKHLKENYADGITLPIGVDENNNIEYATYTPDEFLNGLKSIREQEMSQLSEEERKEAEKAENRKLDQNV